MGDGAMLVWFVLTGLSVAFISVDIRSTPAHPVLKWAFIILALFTGPFAAFFYVLGCREPLRGTHEAYVGVRWRQVLGSTMHCAAGDGIGIIAGAVVAAHWRLPGWADLSLEYVLGFGFGWAIFQAFAMREMAGGDYLRSLRKTLLPEFLSMNLLMTGMVVIRHLLLPHIDGSADPLAGGFWFVMSMALIAGFIFAFPINWWLVANSLKHGMITVRATGSLMQQSRALADEEPSGGQAVPSHGGHDAKADVSVAAKAAMAILTIACFVAGIVLVGWFAP
jgi:Domain of unknown function (DUF4396)